MIKKNPWIPYLAILGLLILWFVYSQFRSKQYEVMIEPLFDFPPKSVTEFTITQDTVSVRLIRADSLWFFAAPDTGLPALYKIEQFVKDVLQGEREGYVTEDTSRYDVYGISKTKAIRLQLKGDSDVLTTILVGRSTSDFNQEFVKYSGDPKVYPSRQKILNKLGVTASWWR